MICEKCNEGNYYRYVDGKYLCKRCYDDTKVEKPHKETNKFLSFIKWITIYMWAGFYLVYKGIKYKSKIWILVGMLGIFTLFVSLIVDECTPEPYYSLAGCLMCTTIVIEVIGVKKL